MTDKPTIYEALSRVMGSVQGVRKGDRNQQQGYNFRGIDAVVNAVGPALREHGVIVVPHVQDVHYNVVEVGQKRTPMRECTVTVRYVFHGPAGDTIDCVSVGEAMDSGDKSTPKAMSVAMRVALLQALCIPTDEPDPDSQAYERAPARQEPSPKAVELFATVDAATTAEELRAAWTAVQDAGKAGEATPAEVAQIKAHITSRGAELAATPQQVPAEQPAEDRTAEPAAELAEQQPMEAEWPEPRKPGSGDPA